MTTQRYYYADSISDFFSRSNNDILAEMTKYSQFSVDPQTRDSWIEEFDSLREVLTEYKDRGSLYLEYNIPRMGTRADVVLLIDGVVLILEYKTSHRKFTHSAVLQVWDYALDLKNFHDETHTLPVIPIVVAPSESDSRCSITLSSPFADGVFPPLCTNQKHLCECLHNVFANSDVKKLQRTIDSEIWEKKWI